MNSYPTELNIIESDQLEIVWSDGQRRHYAVAQLRENCPCATCQKVRRGETPAPEPTDALQIVAMKPVGNYAYAITFSDGHDTGIYTFELLRQLGQSV